MVRNIGATGATTSKATKKDSQLLERLRAGEKLAVQEWFNSYYDRLLAVVLVKVSNPKDAEEIVQETFLNCLKHLPLFRGDSSIWTWMNSIARHEVADYYRKIYAKKTLETLPLHEWLLSREVHDSHEISQQVRLVLNKMRRGYKNLLVMKYVEGKKVAAIARELDRTSKAVESDLFRAREEFRVLWQAEYGAES